MSFSKGGQSSKTGFDRQTQEWINRIYQNTMTQAGQGTNAAGTNQAAGFFGGMLGQAGQGIAAMGGDADAARAFMNPFEDQVAGAINRDWNQINAQTMRGVDDAAQASGAFGGSRHGVATGTALGENARNQMNQLAQLRAGGFESAMGRAGQLANLGFYGANALADTDRQRMEMSPLGIMKYGLGGTPFGTTGKSSGYQVSGQVPWFAARGWVG